LDPENGNTLLIDAHVHLYDCFRLTSFLDAALNNFHTSANRIGCQNGFTGFLLLTETSRDNWFRRLLEYSVAPGEVDDQSMGEWDLHPTREDHSVWVVNKNGDGMFIIAGRQIATREGLEVLSLGTDTHIKDRQSLAKTVEKVRLSGGLPVLPWGPGKWTGSRGKIILEFINDLGDENLFLGDNGNRPFFWPYPAIFQVAEKRGFKILPGSDPLPYASEEIKPGSFGLYVKGEISGDFPAKDLFALLNDKKALVSPFGKRETFWRFMRNQVGMQLKKRFFRQKGSQF
jgi:hypothetical protein